MKRGSQGDLNANEVHHRGFKGPGRDARLRAQPLFSLDDQSSCHLAPVPGPTCLGGASRLFCPLPLISFQIGHLASTELSGRFCLFRSKFYFAQSNKSEWGFACGRNLLLLSGRGRRRLLKSGGPNADLMPRRSDWGKTSPASRPA